MLEHHPDKLGVNPSEREKAEAHTKSAEINEAAEVCLQYVNGELEVLEDEVKKEDSVVPVSQDDILSPNKSVDDLLYNAKDARPAKEVKSTSSTTSQALVVSEDEKTLKSLLQTFQDSGLKGEELVDALSGKDKRIAAFALTNESFLTVIRPDVMGRSKLVDLSLKLGKADEVVMSCLKSPPFMKSLLYCEQEFIDGAASKSFKAYLYILEHFDEMVETFLGSGQDYAKKYLASTLYFQGLYKYNFKLQFWNQGKKEKFVNQSQLLKLGFQKRDELFQALKDWPEAEDDSETMQNFKEKFGDLINTFKYAQGRKLEETYPIIKAIKASLREDEEAQQQAEQAEEAEEAEEQRIREEEQRKRQEEHEAEVARRPNTFYEDLQALHKAISDDNDDEILIYAKKMGGVEFYSFQYDRLGGLWHHRIQEVIKGLALKLKDYATDSDTDSETASSSETDSSSESENEYDTLESTRLLLRTASLTDFTTDRKTKEKRREKSENFEELLESTEPLTPWMLHEHIISDHFITIDLSKREQEGLKEIVTCDLIYIICHHKNLTKPFLDSIRDLTKFALKSTFNSYNPGKPYIQFSLDGAAIIERALKAKFSQSDYEAYMKTMREELKQEEEQKREQAARLEKKENARVDRNLFHHYLNFQQIHSGVYQSKIKEKVSGEPIIFSYLKGGDNESAAPSFRLLMNDFTYYRLYYDIAAGKLMQNTTASDNNDNYTFMHCNKLQSKAKEVITQLFDKDIAEPERVRNFASFLNGKSVDSDEAVYKKLTALYPADFWGWCLGKPNDNMHMKRKAVQADMIDLIQLAPGITEKLLNVLMNSVSPDRPLPGHSYLLFDYMRFKKKDVLKLIVTAYDGFEDKPNFTQADYMKFILAHDDLRQELTDNKEKLTTLYHDSAESVKALLDADEEITKMIQATKELKTLVSNNKSSLFSRMKATFSIESGATNTKAVRALPAPQN